MKSLGLGVRDMSQPEGVTFEEIAKDAVFIAVMGVTGSGKSNFVKLATGSNDAVVGSGLTSCNFQYPGFFFRDLDC